MPHFYTKSLIINKMPAIGVAELAITRGPKWDRVKKSITPKIIDLDFNPAIPLTHDQFRALYQMGFRKFSTANLDNINLSGFDLTDMDISQAKLDHVTLYRTTLTLTQALRIIEQNPDNNQLLAFSNRVQFHAEPLILDAFNALLFNGLHCFTGANLTEIDLRNRKDLISINLQGAILKNIQIDESFLTSDQALQIIGQNPEENRILTSVSIQFPDDNLDDAEQTLDKLLKHGLHDLTGARIKNANLSMLSLENVTLKNVQLSNTTLTLSQALLLVNQNPENKNLLAQAIVQFPTDPLDSNSFKQLYQHSLQTFAGADLTTIKDSALKQSLSLRKDFFRGTVLTLNQTRIILKQHPGHYAYFQNTIIVLPKKYAEKTTDGKIGPSTKLNKLEKQELAALYGLGTGCARLKFAIIEEEAPKKQRRWHFPSWLKTTLIIIGITTAIGSIVGIIPLSIYGIIKLVKHLHTARKIERKPVAIVTPPSRPTDILAAQPRPSTATIKAWLTPVSSRYIKNKTSNGAIDKAANDCVKFLESTGHNAEITHKQPSPSIPRGLTAS